MRMYAYKLALLVDGSIQNSEFNGQMFEMLPQFILIKQEDGTNTLLNHEIVAQLDYKEIK